MNPPVKVPDPNCEKTATSAVPSVPAGVTAVSEEGSWKETLVALLRPMVTVEVDVKPEPEIVMLVPPAIGPVEGLTATTVGGAGGGAAADTVSVTVMLAGEP